MVLLLCVYLLVKGIDADASLGDLMLHDGCHHQPLRHKVVAAGVYLWSECPGLYEMKRLSSKFICHLFIGTVQRREVWEGLKTYMTVDYILKGDILQAQTAHK